jgi:hypothetical protein
MLNGVFKTLKKQLPFLGEDVNPSPDYLQAIAMRCPKTSDFAYYSHKTNAQFHLTYSQISYMEFSNCLVIIKH